MALVDTIGWVGISAAGFWSNKPTDLKVSPMKHTGMIDQSSDLGMWLCPNVYHSSQVWVAVLLALSGQSVVWMNTALNRQICGDLKLKKINRASEQQVQRSGTFTEH